MQTSVKIKILVVDDHSLVRDGITSILEKSEELQVIGSCSSGEEAISLAQETTPDVVLMDIVMRGMTGIEAARWIKEQNDKIKVILCSMEVKKNLVTAGIQAGIDGYLQKDSSKEVLIEAIRSVLEGKKFFTEAITSLIFEDYYLKSKDTPKKESKILDELTKRELEVLEQIAVGLTTREVADRLFISVKTVETHKAHILDKLGLKNTAEIVLYAVKNKIISID
jgi:DNA-binding NarL/FixJ family response regulator